MSALVYPRTLRFSRRQFQYLVDTLALRRLLHVADVPELHAVTVSAKEERELIDRVADRLQEVGFGPEYEVTAEGDLLESIIDAIVPGGSSP